MRISRLGRLVSAITLLLLAGCLGLTVLTYVQSDSPELAPLYSTAIEAFVVCAFGVVGVVLLLRRPESLIGWLLVMVVLGSFFNAYATYSLIANPGVLPGGALAAVIDLSSWTPFVYVVFLLLVAFPSGRPATPRWRLIAQLMGIAVTASFLIGLVTIDSADPPLDGENPLFVEALEPYQALGFAIVLPFMLMVPVAAVDLFLRFRRSKGEERQQFRWLAFAASLILGYFPIYALIGTVNDNLAYTLFNVSLVGLPVAVGIAVLRYRLYDIDRIITRTLVYALLTATLAAVYLGSVVGLQTLLAPLSGGSDLAIALTTLLVAALFLPAGSRIQAAVDRHFNRRSYDAALTVAAFASRLREEIDLDALHYELLSVLDETMQPSGASLWLRTPGVRL